MKRHDILGWPAYPTVKTAARRSCSADAGARTSCASASATSAGQEPAADYFLRGHGATCLADGAPHLSLVVRYRRNRVVGVARHDLVAWSLLPQEPGIIENLTRQHPLIWSRCHCDVRRAGSMSGSCARGAAMPHRGRCRR